VAEIADVQHELQRLRVHLVDDAVELLDFRGRVGDVAEDAERGRAGRKRLERRARREQKQQ
jgi:hypothetical protein